MTDLILKLCPVLATYTYTDGDEFNWIIVCVVFPLSIFLYLLRLWRKDILGEKREYKKLMSQRKNNGPTMEDCETFHHENLFANIQITKEGLEKIEKRKALLDMIAKSGSWVNTPASDSPINKSNLMAKFEPIKFYDEPTTFTVLEEPQYIDYHEFIKLSPEEKAKHAWIICNAPTNEPKEIEPVKCKCCGAPINLAKMVCEYCDTPYERR